MIRLFQKNRIEHYSGSDKTDDQIILNRSDVLNKNFSKKFTYVTVKSKREYFPLKYIRKFVYETDPTFRFTSRYCNTIMVGLVALYYVFLYWAYTVSMNMSLLIGLLPDFVDTGTIEIDLGNILCRFLPDACLPALVEAGLFKFPLPQKILKFFPGLRSWILTVFVLPLFIAALICVGQVFFLIKETKTHLLEMYQGKCEFLKKAKNLQKESIASSSFHFGG